MRRVTWRDEWSAQYMGEFPPLPEGACKRCGHVDDVYFESGRYLPHKYRHRIGRPCCSNKHCLCDEHVVGE